MIAGLVLSLGQWMMLVERVESKVSKVVEEAQGLGVTLHGSEGKCRTRVLVLSKRQVEISKSLLPGLEVALKLENGSEGMTGWGKMSRKEARRVERKCLMGWDCAA